MGKIVLRPGRMMAERRISPGELAERVDISNVNLSKIKNHSDPHFHPRRHLRCVGM